MQGVQFVNLILLRGDWQKNASAECGGLVVWLEVARQRHPAASAVYG